MQLFFENFGVEGTPEELAIFAKSYEADEIRLSECCNEHDATQNEGEWDTIGENTKQVQEIIHKSWGMVNDLFEFRTDGTVILKADRIYRTNQDIYILQLPKNVNFESKEAEDLLKHIQDKLGSNVTVVPIPYGSTIYKHR